MQRPNAIERVIDKLDFGHDRFVSTDRGDKEGCWFPQWVVFNKKKDKARGGRIGRYRWFMNFGAPGPISASESQFRPPKIETFSRIGGNRNATVPVPIPRPTSLLLGVGFPCSGNRSNARTHRRQ